MSKKTQKIIIWIILIAMVGGSALGLLLNFFAK